MNNPKSKILVVDDLPENLHAMRVTLEPLQVTIDTASSGNEALALMLKNEYAVVLLDVQMPQMDGFEAASLMQGNEATRNVPIIFVTAINKEDQHIFKGYGAGAVDYLFKPVHPDILLSKVKVFIKLYRSKMRCERMQQELNKSKNLESLGLLAGGIAHDFNNILAAIVGNIDLAKLTFDPIENKKGTELLTNANKAAMRAKNLTGQLLTFAKGGYPVKAFASIEQIVTDSADFILHGSKVNCHYHYAENLWSAECDAGQISQVIQNIVLNACQAMPDGGNIAIKCHNAPNTSVNKTGQFLAIEISDNGSGIPPALLSTIFDPYMTTKEMGNGLGLSICHSIIKKHDGTIEVESEQGVGTTFRILLPAKAQKVQPKEQETQPVPLGQKSTGTIMVMDDEEMILTLCRTVLTRNGYKVVLAKDGSDAIQRYQEAQESGNPIDLSIMDLTIPGSMGGKEAAEKILNINPEAKIIVSSGYANDPIMAGHQEYGFCSAITKPYEIHTLLTVVENNLGK